MIAIVYFLIFFLILRLCERIVKKAAGWALLRKDTFHTRIGYNNQGQVQDVEAQYV
jgi:hypothetical protein